MNNYYNIYLDDSSFNTIANNTCKSNKYDGIRQYKSSYNIIENNTMISCGLSIYGTQMNHWDTHTISTSNTVNSKPVYYWKNVTGGVVPACAGQVILVNCSNVIIENQNVSNGNNGIQLFFSNNNIIMNNTCTSNIYGGIYLHESNSNKLENNTCTSHKLYMIGYGIYLDHSLSNTIANNNCSDNKYAIKLYYSSKNIISNNTCSDNSDGLFITGSTSNTIDNNSFTSNSVGIWLSKSTNSNKIIDCSIYSNSFYDLYLYEDSINNLVKNSSFDTISVDSTSGIIVKNFLHIQATDSNGLPLSNVDLEVKDNSNVIYATSGYGGTDPKTNMNGQIKWILLTDRIYDCNITAMENITTVNAHHEGTFFRDNNIDVNMSTSHFEYFLPNSLPGKINLINPSNNTYIKDVKPELKWKIGTDPNFDILTYIVEVDEFGGDWNKLIANYQTSPGVLSWTIPIDLIDGNSYQWRVRANDSYANGSWSDIWKFTIDKDIPIANIPLDSGEYNNTGTVRWIWQHSNDTGSGIIGYYVCIGTTPGGYNIVKNAWTTNTWFEKSDLVDGKTYYCKIKTKNGAGTNSSYSRNSDGIFIDTIPPSISIEGFKNLIENSIGDFNISVNISDTLYGSYINTPQLDYKLGKNGTYFGYRNMISSTNYIWYFNIPEPTEGWSKFTNDYVYFKVRCSDSAGNSNETDEIQELIDIIYTINHPPIVRIISPNGGENWTGIYDIIWFAEDLDSDILSFDLKLSENGGNTYPIILAHGLGTNTRTFPLNVSNFENGTNYIIKIIVDDGITTSEDESNSSFIIYNLKGPGIVNHPPIVKIIQPIGGEILTIGSHYMIKWTAFDPDGDSLSFTIELGSDDSGIYYYKPLVTDLRTTARSWTWNTSNMFAGKNNKMKIIAKDNGIPELSSEDTSDGIFTFSIDTDGDGMPDDWEKLFSLDQNDSGDANKDLDEDDLTNLNEYIHGTDPTNPDFDSDKLPDGWEVKFGLNPKDNAGNNGTDGDPDNDGYSNWEEYNEGTYPNDDLDHPYEKPKKKEENNTINILIILIIVLILVIIVLLVIKKTPKTVLIESKKSQEIKTKRKISNLIKTRFNDYFYDNLKNEINSSYRNGEFTATMLLSRKLFENLVIEILRKKYPQNKNGNLEIYFNKKDRRFHDFTILLKNLEERKNEFDSDKKTITEFISLIKPFRKRANDNIHSIIIIPKKDEVLKYDIQQMTALLDRVWSNLK
jgi:parallel beta-helix repeat protein